MRRSGLKSIGNTAVQGGDQPAFRVRRALADCRGRSSDLRPGRSENAEEQEAVNERVATVSTGRAKPRSGVDRRIELIGGLKAGTGESARAKNMTPSVDLDALISIVAAFDPGFCSTLASRCGVLGFWC